MRREINRRRYNSKEISERNYDEKYEMRNEKKCAPGKTFFGGEFNRILRTATQTVVQMKYMYEI